jgi:hypothetical protein
MASAKVIPAELPEESRRDREKISAELSELKQRAKRLDEAAGENSLSGHVRRAIHRSRQPLKAIASEMGIDVYLLCDFLEGTATLRSDVLDRLTQAIGADIRIASAGDLANSSCNEPAARGGKRVTPMTVDLVP